MEEWKQNWEEVFMDKMEKEEKKWGIIKCLETKKDERFNTLLQLSFCVLKEKVKPKQFKIIKIYQKYWTCWHLYF
jgi:hypothetical protein